MDKDHNLGILSSYNAKQERTFEMRAPPRRRNTNKEKESQDSDNQPLFLRKAFVMISNCPPDIGGWSDAGDTVIIKDVKRFEEQVIPTVYKHNNFSSFVRQLNFYGFRKVKSVESIDQPASSLWEFRHPSFLRGQPHLLSEIKRAMHYAGDSSNSVEVQELKNQVANLTDIVSRLKEQVDDLTDEVADMRKRDVSSSSSSFAGRIAPDGDIEHKKRKVVGVKSSARYEGKGGGDHNKTSVPIDLLSNFNVSGGHHDDDYAEDALDVGSLDLFMEEWKAVPENSLPGGGGKKKGGLKSSAPASSSSSSSSSLITGSDKLDFSLILESLPSDLKVRFVDQLADQFGKQLTGPGLGTNLQGFQQYHQPSSHNQPIDSSFYPNQNFNASSLSSNNNNNNNNNNKFQGFPVQNHHMFSTQQDEAHDISLPLASAALGAFMSDINNIPSFEQFSNNSGDSGSNDNNNDNNLDSGHIPDSLDNWYFNI
eukprot:gene22525-30788_t